LRVKAVKERSVRRARGTAVTTQARGFNDHDERAIGGPVRPFAARAKRSYE